MSKYIGKGSYGCIIKPSLKCDKTFGDKNEISKFFFDYKEYNDENNLHNIITNIDKKNKFTIKKISNCKLFLDYDIIRKIENFYSCNIYDKYIYQIIYEYGGIDLEKLLINDKFKSIDLYDFFQRFSNIFEGISILDENDLVHFDLKLNNILYDLEKNKFVIIDFGLMKKKSKLYSYNLIDLFSENQHPFYPNEINILNIIINKSDDKKLNSMLYYEHFQILIKKLQKIYHNSHDKFFVNYLKTFEKISYQFENEIKNNFKSMLSLFKIFFKKFSNVKFYSENIHNNQINDILNEICNDIKSKIDVYMLGIVLLEIIINIFIYSNMNKTIKKIPIELLYLIQKMISFNPCNRPTIQEATLKFKEIMNLL